MKYILMVAIFYCNAVLSQQQVFDVASIPESLKKDAHSIKRLENIDFEIVDVDKAYYRVKTITTVLDPSAKSELIFEEYTDKFHSLDDVDIKVYDELGRVTGKYKKKDLYIQGTGSGLVPEGKVNYYDIKADKFPVTVEFNYTITYHGLYGYPDYHIQGPDESIEHSSFTVRVPKGIDIRYKPLNVEVLPQINEADKDVKIYTWFINSLPAKKYEDGSGYTENSYPRVMIEPNKFELDGYPGQMNTWENLGLWYNSLVKNDNVLAPQNAAEIKRLTEKATSDKEKMKLIYDYLQKNFRYVSIQLGIGGFKPFSADFVHKNKYGDCKALSNYMQACLAAVDIKSYSAWIKGSIYPNNIDPAFPCDPFNHQILCAPLNGDTVWLECTSNTADFGVLGYFTENRPALLLTETGGHLINTPQSKATSNIYHCNTVIDLKEDGSGITKSELQTSGSFKELMKNYIFDQKREDQKKFIVDYFEFSQPDDFDISYDKEDKLAPVKLTMAMEKIPEFTAGNKQFLNPRIYKIWYNALPKTESRTQDYYFKYPFIKTDTTVYNLPAGFSIETLPKPKNLSFEYGSFKTTYTFDDVKKQIITTARLELDEYKIPAAKFSATKQFFNEVLAEFTEKIVIKQL